MKEYLRNTKKKQLWKWNRTKKEKNRPFLRPTRQRIRTNGREYKNIYCKAKDKKENTSQTIKLRRTKEARGEDIKICMIMYGRNLTANASQRRKKKKRRRKWERRRKNNHYNRYSKYIENWNPSYEEWKNKKQLQERR